MGLHDIDKSLSRNGAPKPNTFDNVLNRMAYQTTSTDYRPQGDDRVARLQQLGKTILSNDGTTNRVIFGFNPALDEWGVFSTKSGVDVTTNTDLNEFTFNSNQNTFKINEVLELAVGTTALSVPATGFYSGVVLAHQVAHGKSYIPQIEGAAYLSGIGGYIPFPIPLHTIVSSGPLTGTVLWSQTYISSTDTNINVIVMYTVYNPTAVTTDGINLAGYDAKIYIKQETAN
jgi:hypothetical protein